MRGLMLAGVLVAGLAMAATAQAGGTIRLGNGSDPESIDPHKMTSVTGARIVRDLCEGVVAEDAKNRVVPGLAERWTISPDGTTYTFHLRAGLKWADGTPFKAADLVWSWRRGITPAIGPGTPELMYPIKNAKAVVEGKMPPESLGVTAPDDRTLVVTLERPFPDFLAYTAAERHAQPIQRAAVEKHGIDFTKPGNYFCTGPFTIAEWVPQSHMKLVKNPHYWDAANVKLDAVIYHMVADAQTELKMFRAGELDATQTVPPNQIDWARANAAESLRVSPYAGAYYYTPNFKNEPWKSNVKLRKALALAVDREALIKHILKDNGQTPAYGLVPPNLEGYTQADLPWIKMTQKEREAEAKRLYQEAGYGPGNPLKTEILYNTLEGHKMIAIAVASMWKAVLGVETTLNNQEWKVVLERQAERSYPDMVRQGWISEFPFAYLDLARTEASKAGWNYSDPEFDKLMAEADKLSDPVAWKAKLREAETTLMLKMPVIPLYYYARVQLVSPKVKGWENNFADTHPAKYLSLAN